MIPVLDIQRLRFGIDGPGVRTLIGLAGCPLRCRYCLNPHAWNGSEEITHLTPEQLYDRVRVDNLYFLTTGGGLTFGGGEPLLHMEAIAAFASLCPEGWSLWAETSLAVPEEMVTLAEAVFDCFLVDIKTTDPELYRAYTGGDMNLALKNLQRLLVLAGPERVIVRLPEIPGYTTQAQLLSSEAMLRDLGVRHFDHLIYEKDVEL